MKNKAKAKVNASYFEFYIFNFSYLSLRCE
jgi:hypothetical protein